MQINIELSEPIICLPVDSGVYIKIVGLILDDAFEVALGSIEKKINFYMFYEDEGIKWVKDVKQKTPEMFVQWLKMKKDHIKAGRSDLAGLPSDFTMKDYYYVFW